MLALLLALLVQTCATDPPPLSKPTLAITHPPDNSLVLNPVVVDVDIDLTSVLANDPSLDVATLQLCVSLDSEAFKQCWQLISAPGLPVFDFFESSAGAAQLLRSDAVTGVKQHTLRAWLAFESNGPAIADTQADFSVWSIEARRLNKAEFRMHQQATATSLPDFTMHDSTHHNGTDGVYLAVHVGDTRAEIVASNEESFSTYLQAASRAVQTSLWPEVELAVDEPLSQPRGPPFRVVELPFVRSGDSFGRTFCTSSIIVGSGSSCEVFALVEAMLKVLAARPLCSLSSSTHIPLHLSSQLDSKLLVDEASAQPHNRPNSERRASLLVLGSSSAWVWCGGADSEVVAVEADAFAEVGAHDDSGAGSLWCRGKRTDSEPGGSGIDVRVVPGASASGLNNADSATGALKEFRKVLLGDLMMEPSSTSTDFIAKAIPQQSTNLYEAVVLMVGEVDRSSTLWLKAARRLRNAGTASPFEALREVDRTKTLNASSAAALIEAAKTEAAEAAARLMKFAVQELNGASSVASHAPVVVMAAPLPTMTRRGMMRLAYPHLVNKDDLPDAAQISDSFASHRNEATNSNDSGVASDKSAQRSHEEASTLRERTVADETAVTMALNAHMRRECSAAAANAANAARTPHDKSTTDAEASNTPPTRPCVFADATGDWLDAATGEVHGFFLAAKPDIHAHLERSFFFWKRALVVSGAAAWCADFS